jgi:hypothetical protein
METFAITFFFEVLALAFMVACLEMTFQMFMQKNMILYPWAVLLANIAKHNEVLRHLMRPMGRCRYCNSIWISFYVYVYFFGYNISVLLMFGLTTLFVKLLSDYVFKDVDANTGVDERYKIVYKQDTPWLAMMKSYGVLGAFYSTVYIVIPWLI